MALLLAMYQKMRLIREKNQLTLDLTKYTSKVNRVEKNIQRVQKRYTSLFEQIQAQSKMMQSNAKNLFLNMAGLGANQVNPYDYSGMTQYVMSQTANICKQGREASTDSNGNEIPGIEALTDDQIQDLMTRYRRDGRINPLMEEGENGQLVPTVLSEEDGKKVYDWGNNLTQEQVNYFLWAMDQAKQMQTQQQWQVQQMQTAYESNTNIWAEAQKARLEEEQDAALEPLNYQQTMWELEKTQIEQRLERIKAELESYTNLCKEEAKEQAPKFGLG